MQIQPLPSEARGYATRLKERQLKLGLGLMWEVERVLQVSTHTCMRGRESTAWRKARATGACKAH